MWGRGHCTTALFLCQFAPQGGEKLRQVLPAEKPRVVAATRKKPEILKRKIAGFGFGLQVCATGWQRPGKPLFLPGTGWNTTEGKGPFHARATPQNRAQKKEFPLRNADHKKDFAPRSEKSRLFSWGFTRGVPGHCGEIIPRPRANCRKSPHRKKSGKHRGLSTTRPYAKKIIVYHEGISLPLYAGNLKESPI